MTLLDLRDIMDILSNDFKSLEG